MGKRDDVLVHLVPLQSHNRYREKHDVSYFRKYAELQHLLKQPDVDLQKVTRLVEEMAEHCRQISQDSQLAIEMVVDELIPSDHRDRSSLDELAESMASEQYSDWERKKKSLSEGSIPTSSALPTSKEDEASPLEAACPTCSTDQSTDRNQRKSNRARRVTKDAATANEVDSQIKDDALLEEAINLATTETEEITAVTKNDKKDISERCFHGWAPSPTYMEGEIRDFEDAIVKEYDATDGTLPLHERFQIAHETTKREYAEVWNDPGKLKIVVSLFLGIGAENSLRGDFGPARYQAMFVSYFEQFSASEILKTQASCSWGKVREVTRAVEKHTIVSFFRKRIPCKCLDKRYEEVKSVPKIGICFNENCRLPNGMIKRTEMLQCTQCRMVHYCSRRCQKAAWPSHKECCIADARLRDERKSRQKSSYWTESSSERDAVVDYRLG